VIRDRVPAALAVLSFHLAAACTPADGVEVEPLPPLERPTAEARAGLPALEGSWRFAGWEVANEETGAALGAPAPPGDLVIQTQRIDSVAGYLVRGEQSIPLVGEVRRDGVVSLVSFVDGGQGRFAAGRFQRDTLWLELSTLPAGDLSPPTVRWAFSRGAVGQAFFRLPTGQLLRDTVVALPDTVPVRRIAPAAPPAAEAEVPADEAQPAPAAPPRQPTPRPAPRDTPAAPRAAPQPDTVPALAPPGPGTDIPPG
jgi:hypothetical protein